MRLMLHAIWFEGTVVLFLIGHASACADERRHDTLAPFVARWAFFGEGPRAFLAVFGSKQAILDDLLKAKAIAQRHVLAAYS